eukprot:7963780-Karenia_brevis.AAC.1
MNPVGNDDCGNGDITPNTTNSEPIHNTSWGHDVDNMVSNRHCITQAPTPFQQGTYGPSRVVEGNCKSLGMGICP